MKSLRKALLPGLIAFGFLVFLGAVGQKTPTANADIFATQVSPGDVCAILGPTTMKEGETEIFVAEIASVGDAPGYVAYITGLVQQFVPPILLPAIDPLVDAAWTIAAIADGFTTDVNLDDQTGDSDITSVDKNGDGVTEAIPPTDHLNAVEQFYGLNSPNCPDALTLAQATAALVQFIGISGTLPVAYPVGGAGVAEGANGLPAGVTAPTPASVAAIIIASPNLLQGCINVGNALIAAEVAVNESLADATADGTVLAAACLTGGWTLFFDLLTFFQTDRAIIVDVTCEDAGNFELSFAPEWSGHLRITAPVALVNPLLGIDFDFLIGDPLSIDVRCGSDVADATITAAPTSVEIYPSYSNVAHSLITVSLLDRDGDNANAGDEVMFITNKCSIESSTVDTEAEYEAAATGAGPFAGAQLSPIALVPANAAAIEASVYATTAPDAASRQQEEVNSFVVTGPAATDFAERTIAAVILHCDPVHAPGVTPGDAEICAWIERGDADQDEGDIDGFNTNNDDLVRCVTVKVVGPPAANGVTVTASPASLACGEKAQITVDVKDSIGQPVSDHTLVEAVTNAGGVLGGTGAVAGQQGLVSPVSSTVAETFGGKATIYLLTSTQHVGKYEVLITTGGGGGVAGQLVNGQNPALTNYIGGGFSTPPISVQVTVECTVAAAAPAPTVAAPRTGQGITPPSTGDAGLATSNSSSLVLVAVASVAALAAAGFALKLAREEN